MKISIIGAGNVGSSAASQLILKELANKIVLIDVMEKFAIGRAEDLSQMACVYGLDTAVCGGSDYELIKDSDIVVITAGATRKEGQTRDMLLNKNAAIVSSCAQNIAKYAPNSLIIVVTNPLDEMVYVAQKVSKFDHKRVIGMAGELDSARYKYQISQTLKQKPSKISCYSVGAHSNLMVLANSLAKVEGESVSNLSSKDELEAINSLTVNGGASIVAKTGTSAYFAPGAGIVKMIEAIYAKFDGDIYCCAYDEKSDVYCGQVVVLDKFGVKEIKRPKLSTHEQESVEFSIKAIKDSIKNIKI